MCRRSGGAQRAVHAGASACIFVRLRTCCRAALAGRGLQRRLRQCIRGWWLVQQPGWVPFRRRRCAASRVCPSIRAEDQRIHFKPAGELSSCRLLQNKPKRQWRGRVHNTIDCVTKVQVDRKGTHRSYANQAQAHGAGVTHDMGAVRLKCRPGDGGGGFKTHAGEGDGWGAVSAPVQIRTALGEGGSRKRGQPV